jgi:predicted glycosyltransferase
LKANKGGIKNMKVLIDIGHPAHVHLFKNMICDLEEDGHEVKITARRKEVTLDLLNAYGLKYSDLGEHYTGTFSKAYGMIRRDYKLYTIARKFKPDILVGVHDPYIAQIGKLIRKPSIVFTDTEYVRLSSNLTFPFTDVICTPICFREKLNPQKHVKYNGYHELAYLHPNYFKPDLTVLEKLGLSENDTFIILRFISWGASHDIKLKGIDRQAEIEFIKSLEHYGHVFITSERKLDAGLGKYVITIPPEKMHSLLYYAQLYIGEGGTMAAEAAILGTPSIHIESTSSGIATGELSGNFLELRDKYGLLYFYPDQNKALEKAMSILEDKNAKNEWQKKREKLLKDKIDVTAWMTDFIERYPESFYEYIWG